MTHDSTVALIRLPGNWVCAGIAYFLTSPHPGELPDLACWPFWILGHLVNHLHFPAVEALTIIRTPDPGGLPCMGYAELELAVFSLAHFHVESLAFLPRSCPRPLKSDPTTQLASLGWLR